MMDLQAIREEIDAIDRELTDLFVRRMQLSAKVAGYKRETGMKVFDPAREAAILDRIAERAGEPLGEYARQFYQTLFEVSRAYQTELIGDK